MVLTFHRKRLWGSLAVIAAALVAMPVRAGINAWVVNSGTNDWFGDTNNWSLTHFPVAGEDVVITNVGVGVVLSSAAPASGWLSSLTVSNTARLIFTNWDTTLSATNVAIQKSAMVTCAGPFTNPPDIASRVWSVCSNLTITGSGQINVDGRGYVGSTNPATYGCGPRGGVNGNGGAHGGVGGFNGYASTSPMYPYGDPLAPLLPGSGGGTPAVGTEGGRGGGVVRIEANGHVLVNGMITANGGARIGGQGGGGAGGSIFITCNTIGGTNTVQANGGDGQAWGANGGGGRIAVQYAPSAQRDASLSSLQFSVLPGLGNPTYPSIQADIGTVYFPDAGLLSEPINVSGQILLGTPSWAPSSLTVSNKWIRFPQEGFLLTVTNNVLIQKVSFGRLEIGASVLTNFLTANEAAWPGYRFFAASSAPELNIGGNLALSNGASLCVYSAPTNGIAPEYGSLVNVAGDVTVGIGCWIYPYSHWSNGGSPLFRMRSLTIATNAGFNADKGGYAGGATNGASIGTNGFGPGGGRGGTVSSPMGGSYGGLGGGVTDPGKIYGSSNAPIFPGSGGQWGNTSWGLGGFGGGLVRVEVRRKIILDGILSAQGDAGASAWDASGSGGAIYLSCHTFAGSTNAILRANGGTRTGYNAGGGGRIAVWRVQDGSSGSVSNTAAGGTANGGNGTIVWGWLPAAGTVISVQ